MVQRSNIQDELSKLFVQAEKVTSVRVKEQAHQADTLADLDLELL